jgi:hypothetical protein
VGVTVLLVCIGIVYAGWYFGWAEQLGLVDSPADELCAQSRDPWAAEAVLAGFENVGVSDPRPSLGDA